MILTQNNGTTPWHMFDKEYWMTLEAFFMRWGMVTGFRSIKNYFRAVTVRERVSWAAKQAFNADFQSGK